MRSICIRIAAAPPDRIEYGPQLAADRDDVQPSRYALDEGDTCSDGSDIAGVGVFVRTWAGDEGAWSEPSRLGETGDALQSFRAVGGALHATVTDDHGRVNYVSDGRPGTRIEVPDAFATSLRVGDDRHARIAYSIGEEIRYARVDDDGLRSTTVATSDRYSLTSPALVLAPGDVPTLLWTTATSVVAARSPRPIRRTGPTPLPAGTEPGSRSGSRDPWVGPR